MGIQETTNLAKQLITQGDGLFDAKNYIEAVKHYEKVMALSAPIEIRVIAAIHCGNAYCTLGIFNKAAEYYQSAIGLDPKNAKAYYNLGLVERAFNHLDVALQHYSEAIALQPDYVDAYVNRGNVQLALGHNLEAIADYSAALTFSNEFLEAYHNRSIAYKRLGYKVVAEADLNKAIQLKKKRSEEGNDVYTHTRTTSS